MMTALKDQILNKSPRHMKVLQDSLNQCAMGPNGAPRRVFRA